GDLLTTLCLASRAPVLLAPAMNQAMWLNQATQDNLHKLRERGCHIVGPAEGSQACGDTGPGRMLEPTDIAADCARLFEPGLLSGLHLTITAGPTREAIDPVRFISNHSSGKMGYALAAEAVNAGAWVTLISGPVNLAVPDRVHCIAVTTAQEMLDASLSSADNSDVFIGVAAVADYRVSDTSDHKIKKTAETLQLTLVRNPDIIGTLAARERRPLMVGFAAETQHIEQYGREKLHRKKLDLLFANDATATFNSDEICATALWDQDGSQALGPASKNLVARQMLTLIAERIKASQHNA
ncbi:MAG: bifunctional phosphopantothenoylcysteine decarboxylase/phosphopantothenate--cysteine ligase CoaBC, partial [Pseudohongiella sp.]